VETVEAATAATAATVAEEDHHYPVATDDQYAQGTNYNCRCRHGWWRWPKRRRVNSDIQWMIWSSTASLLEPPAPRRTLIRLFQQKLRKWKIVLDSVDHLDVVILFRPCTFLSLKMTNHSFRYAAPHLWSQLHESFRELHSHLSLLRSQFSPPRVRRITSHHHHFHHPSLSFFFTVNLKFTYSSSHFHNRLVLK